MEHVPVAQFPLRGPAHIRAVVQGQDVLIPARLGVADDFVDSEVILAPLNRGQALRGRGPRPLRCALFGSSQHSRCGTEAKVSTAYVQNGTLYITTTAAHNFVSGTEFYCTVPGMQVQAPITVTGASSMTMPISGVPDTAIDSSASYWLVAVGLYSGASWWGRLHARYGQAVTLAAMVSKHGDITSECELRVPEMLRLVETKGIDLIFAEPGWGNDVNQERAWDLWFPRAMEVLRKLAQVTPLLVVSTLPPPASGGSPTAAAIAMYHRLNQFIRNDLVRVIPNVIVADVTKAPVLDYLANPPATPSGYHSDSLHWKPLGADAIATLYAAALDKVIAPIALARDGASDIYANGGLQLFDGLVTVATKFTTSGNGTSGDLDTSMSIVRAGGGGATCACSFVARSNGMQLQRLAMASMSATGVYTVSVTGAAGALLKDRLVVGHTYRAMIRATINAPSAGKINSISFLAQLSMSGAPASGVVWAGRSQEGEIEGLGSAFEQTAAETVDYIGNDFTIPTNLGTVSAFEFSLIVRSGAAGSGITIDIEDIVLRDVTDNRVA